MDYSPDGKNIIMSLTTKYSDVERKFSVPIDCFYDFIADVRRLNANANKHRAEMAQPETLAPMIPNEHKPGCFAFEEEKGYRGRFLTACFLF